MKNQEIGKDQAPVITIINTYDGTVQSPTYGPALFLTGPIENLGGLVAITNVSGSLGQIATIYGKQVNILAPKGVGAIAPPGDQPYYASGEPYSQWKEYMIWPGGNPASGRPNANEAIAYVVNAIYNPTGTYTTAYDLTHRVIGFAGYAYPNTESYDYFGAGVPWGSGSVTPNDSSKATAIPAA